MEFAGLRSSDLLLPFAVGIDEEEEEEASLDLSLDSLDLLSDSVSVPDFPTAVEQGLGG